MDNHIKDSNDPVHHRWPEGAIVYQIYPRSFYDSNDDGIGDIPGVTKKLDYLKELGVNAIWLSPFYTSPMADFGYDVADYCDVDPIFGKLEDMDELIEKAHEKDIKVMCDLVPNHSSDEHTWFRQSRQSKEDPYSDWYIWRDAKGHDKKGMPIPPNNWIELLTGGPAWEWEPARQQFYLHSFDVKQPDLNWTNPEVREGIKNVMRFWLDRGVDGFRVDAVPFMAKDPLLRDEKPNPHYVKGRDWNYTALIHDNNQGWPHLFAYLSEMASVLKEEAYKGSDRFMVTEAYPSTHERVEEYLSYFEGMGPDVAAPFIFEGFSLPWTAQPWREFLSTFHKTIQEFSPLCVESYAFSNHDQHRLVTRFGEPAAKSAAVLLLTLPGMSFIYNGDEIGMKNGYIPPDMVQDPGAKSGYGRDPERTPLQWSAEKNAGFSNAESTWLPVADNYKTHNVESEENDPDSFLTLYRALGKLRNKSTAIRYGDIEVFEVGHGRALSYKRIDRETGESYTVLINFEEKPLTFTTEQHLGKFVVSSHPYSKLKSIVNGSVHMYPNEAVVFKG